MSKSDFHPPSLARHFDPPKDYAGHFGWIIGFSADASFMNDAAERFTTHTKAQRASAGRIALALFLDPHNPPISLADAPGVAHVPFANFANKPCRLVHAKVAILGFRHTKDPKKWCVRLLVSTGNWTLQTLVSSLDLAWAVDVFSYELNRADDEDKVACADIKAADGLMRRLRGGMNGFFDVRLLQSMQAIQDQQEVDEWISECAMSSIGSTPRFFDNRDKSMLAKLPQLVEKTGAVRRNYLALGSGFYEGEKASVPQKIVAKLRESGLLANNAKIDIFVNPAACQSVAASVETLKREDITVRPAKAPALIFGNGTSRTLHAKFLFSANDSKNSNKCNSAWVYLGSGNLTNPGFAQKMSANGGNLEAGVVFRADGLLWCGDKKGDPAARVVTNLLPIEKDDGELNNLKLDAGEGWESEPPSHFAPPVAWLVWHENQHVCELHLPEDASDNVPFVIVNDAGEIVQQNDETYFPWSGAQPQLVRCEWESGNERRIADVPVMDSFGRIAAVKLSPIENMEEAWLQLADFPNPPDVDDSDEMDGSAVDGGNTGSSTSANASPASSYPIRQMMELLEQIAAKQTEIPEHDWLLWCCRVEQTLVLARGSKVVDYFAKDLKLNPLAPLRQASFRPDYVEGDSSVARQKYEDALKRIEASWGVHSLAGLGGQP